MNIFRFALKSVKFSPLRTYQYEYISKLKLSGKILDLGGGGVATYSNLFKGDYEITSININPKINPTIVGDITKPFPLKDNEFDATVSFNTFEHIFNYDTPMSETFRVLKSSGNFIFSIPFLHQIHGSPDDYWRYSASALENLLKKHGFVVKRIIPLGRGIFVAQYSLIYGAIPRILRPFFAFFALCLDGLLDGISSRYRKSCMTHNYPLGYFVYAEKP